MSYKESIDSAGCIFKEWRNELGMYHRKDGPAAIHHYPDGSIHCEEFWINAEFLGNNKYGFWAFWDRLTEVGRQAPDILKCLARYS